jgi:hypothetical protein
MQLLDEHGIMRDMEGETTGPFLFGLPNHDIRPGDRWRLTGHSGQPSDIWLDITGAILRIDETEGQRIAVLQEDFTVTISCPLEIGSRALDGIIPAAAGCVFLTGSDASLVNGSLVLQAHVTSLFNIDTGRFVDRQVAFEIHETGSLAIERDGDSLSAPVSISVSGNERSEFQYED